MKVFIFLFIHFSPVAISFTSLLYVLPKITDTTDTSAYLFSCFPLFLHT